MNKPAGILSHFGGIGRALSIYNYRVYWTGQLLMVQGFWIQKIAAGFLIYDMTNSPAWLGAVGFGYHIPILIFGPFAGAIADRLGLRFVAIVMSFLGVAISMAMAVLIWTDVMTPLLLVLLMTLQGTQFAFEFPARQSLIGRLVDRQNLSAAVAVNSTTFHSSGFTGPLIGGLLLQYYGAGSGFAANAFCMLWMTTALLRIHPPVGAAQRLAERRLQSSLLQNFKEGFAYALQHPHLKFLFLGTFFVALLVRPYLDFMPGFAIDVFNRGEQGLANMLAASGVGAFCFAFFLALHGATRGLTRILSVGLITTCLALIGFALTDIYNVGLVALFFVGGFLVAASISAQTLVQHCLADEFRGRVISIYVSISVGVPAIGTLAMGWIAESLGLQMTLVGITVIALIAFIPLVVIFLKRDKEIEAEPV